MIPLLAIPILIASTVFCCVIVGAQADARLYRINDDTPDETDRIGGAADREGR